jgi:hypothetical protein
VDWKPGRYRAEWFSARTGETVLSGMVDGPSLASTTAPDGDDWALLLLRK